MATAVNSSTQKKTDAYRKKLIADLPVKERQLQTGEIRTTYLEGGEGIPLVLLHGPGESAVWWMRVIPYLVKKCKVLVPDLPGHGSSGSTPGKLDKKTSLKWLDAFLEETCSEPAVLVGHVVGGALAARYAIQDGNKLKQLVLVDSLGLSAFRPAPRFAFELLRFMVSPTEKSYLRFLPHCMYDVPELSRGMGENWQPFLDYNLALANHPEKKSAVKDIIRAMSGKIPDAELEKIDVPVTLIWGRHDKANKLKVAEKASKKFGWPLHIIEDTRDDPKLERPGAFVAVVQSLITEPRVERQR